MIRWEISLGEIVLSTATLAAAWYVGSALKRKQDRDIAGRELVRYFCRESLQLLAATGDAFLAESSPNGRIDAAGEAKLRAALQRLSNSIHTVKVSIERGNPKEAAALMQPHGALTLLLNASEGLEASILDPISEGPSSAVNVRKVEGKVSRMREAIVVLELDIVSRLE